MRSAVRGVEGVTSARPGGCEVLLEAVVHEHVTVAHATEEADIDALVEEGVQAPREDAEGGEQASEGSVLNQDPRAYQASWLPRRTFDASRFSMSGRILPETPGLDRVFSSRAIARAFPTRPAPTRCGSHTPAPMRAPASRSTAVSCSPAPPTAGAAADRRRRGPDLAPDEPAARRSARQEPRTHGRATPGPSVGRHDAPATRLESSRHRGGVPATSP